MLWPILGNIDSSEKGQINALNQLLYRWRIRASELYSAGWNTVQAEKGRRLRLQLTRNCRPMMGKVDLTHEGMATDKVLFCNTRVCPFCYARKVVPIVVAARQLVGMEVKLVGVRFRLLESAADTDPTVLVRMIRLQHERLVATVDANARLSRGITYDLTVEPTQVKNASYWSFTHRLLLIQPRDSRLYFVPKVRHVRVADQPTPEEVGNILTFALRYPAGLFNSDAGLAARALNAQHKMRLAGSIGVFRGHEKQKEREEDQ